MSTSTIPAAPSGLSERLQDLLTEMRARTLMLVAPLSDDDARTQHDALLSPIVWDLGHIAGFEELWLLRNLDGAVGFGEMPGVYNPFEHPRRERGALPLPSLGEALAVLADVRDRVLARLASFEPAPDDPLSRDGYVYRMVAQHEAQHVETILQALQIKGGAPYSPVERRPVSSPRKAMFARGAMVRVPACVVSIGTDDRTAAYDNERPRHDVAVASFDIDVAPVTNGEYLEFMKAGGYARDEWWSDAGRAWLAEARAAGIVAPKYWFLKGADWWTRSMDRQLPVDLTHPVIHVCYYEAEAYASWAGKRLPTEFEWEAAATWDPASGRARAYPWGEQPPSSSLANVDQLAFGTAPVGAYPRNVSPVGCYGMIGDVWEWTSSDFAPYPGYETFPYREYSQIFFGPEYKVLRGGSWATRPLVARTTFRNWDYPIRRQIFSGFRCAIGA